MGLMHAMFSSLASRYMFHPPELPFYTLNEEEGSKKLKLRLRHILNPNIPSCKPEYLESLDIFKIRTKRRNDIVALYVKNPSASWTILYSHTNAEDLGVLLRDKSFRELSDDLGVNVMPSEKDTYADIEAAYGCLVDKYGAKEEDVILYGRSIGSGPTIDLATRLPKLRGVVLESGITSVFRVASLAFCGVVSKRQSYSFDIYKNLEKIALVSCPVVVIHGTDDEMVDLWHGEQLWSHSKYQYEPLWIEGGKHNDLDKYPQFTEHLKKFVSDMEIESGYRRTSQRSRRGSASSEEDQSSTKSLNVDQPEEQTRNVNGKRFISGRLLNCFKPASTK
ncbi:hypothetical protein ACLB2K_072233 [Fragaria x ananassa]